MKFVAGILALVASASAHSYMIYPTPRNTGTGGQTLGAETNGCEPSNPNPTTSRITVAATGGLQVVWACNHKGQTTTPVYLSVVESSGTPTQTAFTAVRQGPFDYNNCGVQLNNTFTTGTDYVLQFTWANYVSCSDLNAQNVDTSSCNTVGCPGEQECIDGSCVARQGALADAKYGACVACSGNGVKECRYMYDASLVKTAGQPCAACNQCVCKEGYNGTRTTTTAPAVYSCNANKCSEECHGDMFCGYKYLRNNNNPVGLDCVCPSTVATGVKCDKPICALNDGKYTCSNVAGFDGTAPNNRGVCNQYNTEGVEPFCECAIGYGDLRTAQNGVEYTDRNCYNDIGRQILNDGNDDNDEYMLYLECPEHQKANSEYKCVCAYGYKNVTSEADPDGECVRDKSQDSWSKVEFTMYVQMDETLLAPTKNATEHKITKTMMVDLWHVEVKSEPKNANDNRFCYTYKNTNYGTTVTNDVVCYRYDVVFYGDANTDAVKMYKTGVLNVVAGDAPFAGFTVVQLESKAGNYGSAAAISVNVFFVVVAIVGALFF